MDEKDDFSFEFDQLQPEEPRADQDKGMDLTVPAPTKPPTEQLTCSCPKCGTELKTQLPEEARETFTATCTACNSTVAIVRESSANRARRRSRKLSCANCGNPLDHHIHCTSCGAFFPDYHVAVDPQDVRRKARSKRLSDFKHSLDRFNPSFYLDFLRRPGDERRQRPPVTTTPSRAFVTPRTLRLVVSLLAITLLAGGASYAFQLHQRQQQFARSYFKTLYCIKTGNDYNIKFCARMAEEWKMATASGVAFTPRLSDGEKNKVGKIQHEVDRLMQQLGTPPGKFAQTHQKLVQLRESYQKSHNLALSPPQTLQALTAATDQAESGFKTTARELKNSMPESFKEEFERTKQKYRGMQDF
jgi:hypothetical protein